MDEKRKFRKQQKQESNRREVIEATVTLFYKKGYNGVTVPEIARAVEFGVGTLYRLFPGGKEDIYHAMQEIVVKTFEEKIEKFMAGVEDEVEIIRQYIRAAAAVYEAYPKQMAMYLRDTAGVGLDLGYGLEKSLAHRYRACAEHVEKAIRKGEEKGRFKAFPHGAAVMCLRTMINGFFINCQETGKNVSPGENSELIEAFFLGGLMTGKQ
jgi:AcrR family transcriptional regulator